MSRVASFLDKCGILLLNKAQIRLYLEYGTLTWMSSTATYPQKLAKVNR